MRIGVGKNYQPKGKSYNGMAQLDTRSLSIPIASEFSSGPASERLCRLLHVLVHQARDDPYQVRRLDGFRQVRLEARA
jgi:hypothetical protein